MTLGTPELRLSDQARDRLRAAARASRRRERGGILLGYRSTNGLVIEEALDVADESAGHGRYLRRSKRAQEVLATYLKHQVDPMIGYVGEWHTHPSPVPPSAVDHASMFIMAVRNKEQVALVVAALKSDRKGVLYYALATDAGSGQPWRSSAYRKAKVVL